MLGYMRYAVSWCSSGLRALKILVINFARTEQGRATGKWAKEIIYFAAAILTIYAILFS